MKNNWNCLLRKMCASLLLTGAMGAAGFFLGGCKSASPAGAGAEMEVEAEASKMESSPHPILSLTEFEAAVAAHKYLILDARNVDDYRHGHIPGALNLPDASFVNDYERLAYVLRPHQNDLVIVYCSNRWCDAADDLQMKLIARGHQRVALFPGGMAAWQHANLPEEQSN